VIKVEAPAADQFSLGGHNYKFHWDRNNINIEGPKWIQ